MLNLMYQQCGLVAAANPRFQSEKCRHRPTARLLDSLAHPITGSAEYEPVNVRIYVIGAAT